MEGRANFLRNINTDVAGKKLLILGGTTASLNLVENAKEMGVYTIVADDREDGVAKKIADEAVVISTTDIEGLKKLITEKNIDGAFCGPSEFNIQNLIKLCEATGLFCYATSQQWQECANKDVFKKFCREYNVDCTPEYEITEDTTDEELEKIDYPIILKPVDGCSSYGITVCADKTAVRDAYKKAMDASKCKRIIAEKYIDNGGALFGARYLLQDGEAYPYLLIDTYVADPIKRTSLISAFTYTPSKYSEYYMEKMDANVRKMLKGMGLKNGTAFFQSLPCDGKIYFHEMGYRLSGGMIYKLTDPLMGINDMKMMIRLALGGKMYYEEEIKKVNVLSPEKVGAQLMVPMNAGTVTRIEGLQEVLSLPCIADFIQYYNTGDVVEKRFIGTLSQHFGRFTLVAETCEEIYEAVEKIQKTLKIYDENDQEMNVLKFDLGRI